MAADKCLICGQDAGVSSSQNFGGKLITCSRCGKIILEESALCHLEGKEGGKFQSCLYYYFTHYKRNNGRVYLIIDSDNTNEEYNTVSVKQILNLYPKDFAERIDKILLNWEAVTENIVEPISLMELCSSYRQMLFIDYELDNGMLENNHNVQQQIQSVIDILLEQGFIRKQKQGSMDYLIDYNGWRRIDKLRKEHQISNKGFVAMWFNEATKPYREKIKEAITEMGYLVSIIDEKEHNNQIVPEILYEIRTSDFVVADLTGNRGGVYYEAGYALGLDKELIITVNETLTEDKDKPHFDVAQRNQIRYNSPNDLKQKLKKRIEATVGDRSKKIGG